MNKIEVIMYEKSIFYKRLLLKSPRTNTICEIIQEKQTSPLEVYFIINGAYTTPPTVLVDAFKSVKAENHGTHVSFPAYKLSLIANHITNWVAYN